MSDFVLDLKSKNSLSFVGELLSLLDLWGQSISARKKYTVSWSSIVNLAMNDKLAGLSGNDAA